MMQSKEPRQSHPETVAGIRLCLLLAVAIALLCLLTSLTGCNGSARSAKPELHPFTANPPTYTSTEDAVAALNQLCYQQPEVMASTISAFPNALKIAGITTTDPILIDELLSSTTDAAMTQIMLAMGWSSVLKTADYTIDTWSGRADVLYMYQIDPDAEPTPANFALAWDTAELKDEAVLGIHWRSSDGSEEYFGYYLISGGFQRLIPKFDVPATDSPST